MIDALKLAECLMVMAHMEEDMKRLHDRTRPMADDVTPSDYIWDDMDSGQAHRILGLLLDNLMEKEILTLEEIERLLPPYVTVVED